MSSKKIFAASLAAILATGAVASYAVADDYEITIDGTAAGAEYTESAKITISTGIWTQAFDADTAALVAADGDWSKLGFTEIKAGLWEAFKDFEITSTNGATLSVNVRGYAQKFANDQLVERTLNQGVESWSKVTTVGYLPLLKDGAQLVVTFSDLGGAKDGSATTGDTIKVTHIKKGDVVAPVTTELTLITQSDETTEKALWDKVKALKEDELQTLGLTNAWFTAEGLEIADNVEIHAEDSQTLGTTWKDAENRPGFAALGGPYVDLKGEGKTLGPVTLKPAFSGLGNELRLVNVDGAWFHLYGEFGVTGNTYDKYIADNYVVDGAAGSWDATHWSNTGSSFYDDLSDTYGLGIIASSTRDKNGTNGGYAQSPKSGWEAAVPAEVILAKEPEVVKKKADLLIAKAGQIDLSYYGVVNPNVLKNLNNGGTVTFTLDKDVSNATVYGAVRYLGSDGWHIIDADDSYTVSGKTITFSFPSGLTYHENLKDKWHPFLMQWQFRINDWGLGGIGGEGNFNGFAGGNAIWDSTTGGPSVDSFDGNIVSITFKANKEGSDSPSIEDPNNSGSGNNSGNNSGNTSNPGSTSGNPNTGIALAVAPVVLAAGAVVTLVSKKRK